MGSGTAPLFRTVYQVHWVGSFSSPNKTQEKAYSSDRDCDSKWNTVFSSPSYFCYAHWILCYRFDTKPAIVDHNTQLLRANSFWERVCWFFQETQNMFTWCYCLNVTLLSGLHICILKSNDCISRFLKAHKILCFPSGRVLQHRLFVQTGQAPVFENSPQQSEDLQNSIKETTNCRETAMALKASTHTHRELLFLPQNPTTCHPPILARDTPCHLLSGRVALMDAAGAGPVPVGESRDGAAMHEAQGKERPVLPSRMRHNSILREWIWVPGSIYPGTWGLKFISKAHVKLYFKINPLLILSYVHDCK